MQQLHEMELEYARKHLQAEGRDPDQFDFRLEFMEPDPDGGGMFTLHYQIDVTNRQTGKANSFIGGIGMDWVDRFESALSDGEFD